MHRFFCLLLLLVSCHAKRQEDFQARSRTILSALILDLREIDDLDTLIEAQARLQGHFDALVDLMIEARKYEIKTKRSWKPSEEDHLLSRELIGELNRILSNPLTRHLLEKAQNPALERLDAFEKRSGNQKGPSYR